MILNEERKKRFTIRVIELGRKSLYAKPKTRIIRTL